MSNGNSSFTWAEFEALPRIRGRIIDFPNHFLRLTQEQVDLLHSDDWSYYYELQEELEMMIREMYQ